MTAIHARCMIDARARVERKPHWEDRPGADVTVATLISGAGGGAALGGLVG